MQFTLKCGTRMDNGGYSKIM